MSTNFQIGFRNDNIVSSKT